MALLQSPGATAVLLGQPGTKRDDISEGLLAVMAKSNNLIGALSVGAPFNDNIARWVEDALNPSNVTDLTSGGQTISPLSTTLTLSDNDAKLLRIGFVLADTSAAAGGLGGGEQVVVKSVQGNTVQIGRGFGGTTPTTHAQSAVFQIISDPDIEVSGLNNDMSRSPVPKYNYLTRHARDVIVSNEALIRAKRGYVPGKVNEFRYQFDRRMEEMTQIASWNVLYSRPYAGRNGQAGAVAGDYSTFAGLYAMLDGSLDGTFTNGTDVIDGSVYASGDVASPTSLANMLIAKNGGQADWAACGAFGAQDFGRLYSDKIRLNQNEMTRGWASNVFRTLMGNELDVMLDFHIEDTTGIGQIFVLDSSRLQILPKVDEFCTMITAPTLLDAGVCRVVSKYSFAIRNTGDDVGQAHYLINNLTFTQN